MLRYLENAVAMSETKESLVTKLGMSNFLITKTVQELNIDFYQIGLNEEFKIYSDGYIIKLIETNELGIIASDALLTYYLDQSLKFSLLKECFFEQLSSLHQFAINHYLSHTPVYREFRQLKSILKEYAIQVNKEFRLVADECELRAFIFSFFIKDYHINQFLFPVEVIEKQKSVSYFYDKSWLNSEQSFIKRNRLDLYLCIMITRTQNYHFIQRNFWSNIVTSKQTSVVEEIKLRLFEIVPMASTECIEHEATALFGFLILDGWLVDSEQYIDKEQSFIKQMNVNFLTAIQKQFGLSSEIMMLLCHEITTIHYELLFSSLGAREGYQCLNLTYFSDTYPEFTAFCNNYLKENSNSSIFWSNRDFLFFRYLVMLISIIPLKEISKSFYICVDFSFGSSYNQMIQKKIYKMLDLNIKFQNFPDDNTNLILSNLPFYEEYLIDHILWVTPPEIIDWIKFTEKVAGIRRKGMNA